MIKAVFITNIPSPYRVDFFAYLQKHYPEYEFHIIFSGAGMENRKWSVELAELSHYHFLKSKTLIIRKRFDDRYVFLPVGVEKLLAEIKPDLVFAMEYNPTILRAVHWCRKKRIPFISWNIEFGEKYREGAAAFAELHHKACGGVRGEQHRIEAGADCIRGG